PCAPRGQTCRRRSNRTRHKKPAESFYMHQKSFHKLSPIYICFPGLQPLLSNASMLERDIHNISAGAGTEKSYRSLVRYGGTRGATQRDHLGATESNLPTPPVEVPTRKVKRVAKLDKHIERCHQTKGVAPSLVIDQGLDHDKSAALWQGVIRGSNELHLLLQIPIVQDHAHGNHVRFRQGITEEVQ